MSVLVDRPDADLLRLRIDRPDKRNAIDHAVREGLVEALRAARLDGRTRAVIIGGVGGAFSAGGDIGSMAELTQAQARERMRHIHRLCRELVETPLPVVAATEGYCAGAGVGLALLCDVVVAGSATQFLFPFFRLGLLPDWGLLRTLPARVGPASARRLLLGAAVTGTEAARLGLADEDVGEADVMDAAIERSRVLARLPQAAFAAMKARFNRPSSDFEEEFRREENEQTRLLTGSDFREGFAAFVEKRVPDFKAGPRS